MAEELKPKVAAVVYTLQAAYGARFRFEPAHAFAWNSMLADYSADDLKRATQLVIEHHTHGAPGAAEIIQALKGRWETRKVARTDANCNPAPQTLGYEYVLCLVEYGSGQVVRSFNSAGDLIEWGTQRQLASAARVPAHLAPPAGQLRELPAPEVPSLEQPDQRGEPMLVDFMGWET